MLATHKMLPSGLSRIFSAFILSISIVSCSGEGGKGGETSNEGKDKKLRIAVIPKGSTHSYWKAVNSGAQKAGEELGVEVIWQGPQKEDDRQMQIQTVQNFISRGVDGVVLAPLDQESLAPPVAAAVRRGIPVVIIDSDLKGEDFSSFVATDNYAGGRLCAEQMNTLLGGKGRVIMLRYQEGSASTMRREQGFEETIKAIAPGIELVSSNQYAGSTIEKAFQTSQNLLTRFGQIDGVFTSNESTTQGMLRALENSNRAGSVKFVGFDANSDLIKALKASKIHGLAVQNPYQMGYEGVRTIVAVLRKSSYDKTIDTGVKLVTLENVDEADVQAVLPK